MENEYVSTDLDQLKKITVCIVLPVIPEMFEYFLTRFLPTLLKQTVFPEEVILAVSSYKITNKKFEDEVKTKIEKAGIKFKILPSKKLVFAGGNRLRGSFAATSEVITFMDPDDYMHNQRIQFIKSIFLKKPINGLLHTYEFNKIAPDTFYKQKQIEQMFDDPVIYWETDKVYDEYKKTAEEHDKDPHSYPFYKHSLHMGHFSVRRIVFETNIFDPNAKRGEDSCFVRDILQTYTNQVSSVGVIFLKLSSYFPNKFASPRIVGQLAYPRPWCLR